MITVSSSILNFGKRIVESTAKQWLALVLGGNTSGSSLTITALTGFAISLNSETPIDSWEETITIPIINGVPQTTPIFVSLTSIPSLTDPAHFSQDCIVISGSDMDNIVVPAVYSVVTNTINDWLDDRYTDTTIRLPFQQWSVPSVLINTFSSPHLVLVEGVGLYSEVLLSSIDKTRGEIEFSSDLDTWNTELVLNSVFDSINNVNRICQEVYIRTKPTSQYYNYATLKAKTVTGNGREIEVIAYINYTATDKVYGGGNGYVPGIGIVSQTPVTPTSPFANTDIKLYLSGSSAIGEPQTDPAFSTGGFRSGTEISLFNETTDTLFPSIAYYDRDRGSSIYRALFFVNNSGQDTEVPPTLYMRRYSEDNNILYVAGWQFVEKEYVSPLSKRPNVNLAPLRYTPSQADITIQRQSEIGENLRCLGVNFTAYYNTIQELIDQIIQLFANSPEFEVKVVQLDQDTVRFYLTSLNPSEDTIIASEVFIESIDAEDTLSTTGVFSNGGTTTFSEVVAPTILRDKQMAVLWIGRIVTPSSFFDTNTKKMYDRFKTELSANNKSQNGETLTFLEKNAVLDNELEEIQFVIKYDTTTPLY